MTATRKKLGDFLVGTPERETAGAMASDRFDYQKNWALLHLLQLHQGGADYALLCEFHEDVTVIDSVNEPTRAAFYQVKTDEKNNWTLNRLTRRPKSSKSGLLPSIVGKLCSKVSQLDCEHATFQFVTNASFSFRNEAGQQSVTDLPAVYRACELLAKDDWKKLTAAVSAEIGQAADDAALRDRLMFVVADLPLKMHNEAARGVVASFLEEYAPNCVISPGAFYRTLFDELKRRTSAERPVGTLEDICHRKGISRLAFDRMIEGAIRAAPVNSAWPSVMQELQLDRVPVATRLALDAAHKSYYVRTLNAADRPLNRDARKLVAIAATLCTDTSKTMLEIASDAVAIAGRDPDFGLAGLSSDEARVLVMVELYERQLEKIQDADTELEGEDA